jgi:hypothetical protein
MRCQLRNGVGFDHFPKCFWRSASPATNEHCLVAKPGGMSGMGRIKTLPKTAHALRADPCCLRNPAVCQNTVTPADGCRPLQASANANLSRASRSVFCRFNGSCSSRTDGTASLRRASSIASAASCKRCGHPRLGIALQLQKLVCGISCGCEGRATVSNVVSC